MALLSDIIDTNPSIYSQVEMEVDYDQRVTIDHGEWCLGWCSEEKSVVASMWIYKIKYVVDGDIKGYKERLVVSLRKRE